MHGARSDVRASRTGGIDDVDGEIVGEARLVGRFVDQHVEDRRRGVRDDQIVGIVAVIEVLPFGHETSELVPADPHRLHRNVHDAQHGVEDPHSAVTAERPVLHAVAGIVRIDRPADHSRQGWIASVLPDRIAGAEVVGAEEMREVLPHPLQDAADGVEACRSDEARLGEKRIRPLGRRECRLGQIVRTQGRNVDRVGSHGVRRTKQIPRHRGAVEEVA